MIYLFSNYSQSCHICFIPGYYQANVGQATCDVCPAGQYCDPYELFNATGIIDPVSCPAGSYCPAGTEFANQNPCEPGTWSNVTQLTQQSECLYILRIMFYKVMYLLKVFHISFAFIHVSYI